jgi:hypothetical protein
MNSPLIVAHIPTCRWKGKGHTDAAKRISDATNLHKVAGGWDTVGRFIACRLSDGTGGETLYDTHFDAVRHQPDADLCLYIRLRAEGMNVCDAELYLWINRQAHDNGMRLTDPDKASNNRTLIPRVSTEHQYKTLRGLRRR